MKGIEKEVKRDSVLETLRGRVSADEIGVPRNLRRKFSSAITEEDIVFVNSDINGDGKINTKDLAAVKRIVAQ
ncbi:MAG: hypothetical protein IJS45_02840 [Clostridia bacterium]|nr:hypothetical protein [Clostridia bacterium]